MNGIFSEFFNMDFSDVNWCVLFEGIQTRNLATQNYQNTQRH